MPRTLSFKNWVTGSDGARKFKETVSIPQEYAKEAAAKRRVEKSIEEAEAKMEAKTPFTNRDRSKLRLLYERLEAIERNLAQLREAAHDAWK